MPAIVLRRYEDCQRDYHNELRRLAELAFSIYSRNNYDRLYLIGRRAMGIDSHNPLASIWAEWSIASDIPDGWEIVRAEHIPISMTAIHMAALLRDWTRREPCWLYANCA